MSAEQVELYGFTYWRLPLVITGVSEILMHNPVVSMNRSPEEVGRGKSIPPPEVEAKRGLYALSDGRLYLPAISLRNSVLGGASKGGFRIRKVALRSLLPAALLIEPNEIPLTREGASLTVDGGYTVDVRRAVIKRSGIMRARPMIMLPWECAATAYVDSALYVTESMLEGFMDVLRFAGQFIGICDYRPEKSGWFGRFTARSG